MVMMQLSDRDEGWPRRSLVRTTRDENRQSYRFCAFPGDGGTCAAYAGVGFGRAGMVLLGRPLRGDGHRVLRGDLPGPRRRKRREAQGRLETACRIPLLQRDGAPDRVRDPADDATTRT